jgi:Fic family protein
VRLSGDWEGWLKFFLRGVVATADEAAATAERIFELREAARARLLEEGLAPGGLSLLSLLFGRPLVNISLVQTSLDVSFPTASRLVGRFEELRLLREITDQKRGRIYRFDPYLSLFDEPRTPADEDAPVAETGA